MREVVEHETFAEVIGLPPIVVEQRLYPLISFGEQRLDESEPDPDRFVNQAVQFAQRGIQHEIQRRAEAWGQTGHVRVLGLGPGSGIDALTTLAPIALGTPLCTAHSAGGDFDGLEIALKGGQVGSERFFEQVRRGEARALPPT